MSNRRRLPRQNDNDPCDICGRPDYDDTRYGITVKAATPDDIPGLTAYVRHDDDIPAHNIIAPWFLVTCPNHTEDETLKAGFVPWSLLNDHLREVIRITGERKRDRLGPGPAANILRVMMDRT